MCQRIKRIFSQYIISELASLTNSRRGFTLASKTKMWLSAHRAEQWSSLGWRLQRLAPLTSLAAVGRRRRAAAHERGGGCWDGSQRAWSAAAACYQAVGSGAVLAVVRWLSSAAAVLRFSSRKANLGKGIQLSSVSHFGILVTEFWDNFCIKYQGIYPWGAGGATVPTLAEYCPKSLILAMNFRFLPPPLLAKSDDLPPHFRIADKCPVECQEKNFYASETSTWV